MKQSSKVEQMKRNGADSHDIQKQEEVLNETLQMIPETRKRLEAANTDLKEHMVGREVYLVPSVRV